MSFYRSRQVRRAKIELRIDPQGDIGSGKPIEVEACMGGTNVRRARCGIGKGRTVKQATAAALRDLIKTRLR